MDRAELADTITAERVTDNGPAYLRMRRGGKTLMLWHVLPSGEETLERALFPDTAEGIAGVIDTARRTGYRFIDWSGDWSNRTKPAREV